MTDSDYALLPTSRLIEMFRDSAGHYRLGQVFALAARRRQALTPPSSSEESMSSDEEDDVKRASKDLFSIALALALRDAKSEIESLYRDDDPNVRFASGLFLNGYNEEIATAARQSVSLLLTTEEVLARRRQAREIPPVEPALHELTDEALVARFEDAAIHQSAAGLLDWVTKPEDLEARNRWLEATGLAIQELGARHLLTRLEPYLESPDLTVRYRAAQGCLPICEAKAKAALESVVAVKNRNESISAGYVLDSWRKGVGLVLNP
jgi:hypothetical protein